MIDEGGPLAVSVRRCQDLTPVLSLAQAPTAPEEDAGLFTGAPSALPSLTCMDDVPMDNRCRSDRTRYYRELHGVLVHLDRLEVEQGGLTEAEWRLRTTIEVRLWVGFRSRPPSFWCSCSLCMALRLEPPYGLPPVLFKRRRLRRLT